MKRLNYLQVHRNKSAKKIKPKKINPVAFKIAVIKAMSIVQHQIIMSQSGKLFADKMLALSENIRNCADVLNSVFKEKKQQDI